MMTPAIRTYWVPRFILDRSWLMLRQDGLKQVESTVLWGGRRFGDNAVVMSVLYPCGPDVAMSGRLLRVGPDTTAEMGRWLRAQGQRALAQIHTHPGAWVDHSSTDDDHTIASNEGFISIVWPRFAAVPLTDLTEAGVHRLRGGKWARLSREEVHELFRVTESEAMVWVQGETDDNQIL
jgi:hypothetical protein